MRDGNKGGKTMGWLVLAVIVASVLNYLIFRKPSTPKLPKTRQMVSSVPPEYYNMAERYQRYYSTWPTIPVQECLPQYTPAYRDPAVQALHPSVARDILAAVQNAETMKKIEEN